MQLGDRVERALSAAGITQDRVKHWVGDCNCEDRKQRLNRLGEWATRILAGKTENAEHYLKGIMDE